MNGIDDIKIIIIENDKLFSNLLKRTLEIDVRLKVVAEYAGIQIAENSMHKVAFDLAIVNIQLPDGLGSKCILDIKNKFPQIKCVVCATFEDDIRIFDAIKNGADGYIVKLDSSEKIIDSVVEVNQGGACMTAAIAKKVLDFYLRKEKSLQQIDILTKQENLILSYLSEGLFYKDIAFKTAIKMDTVKKHASNIYKKLQVNNRTEAVNLYLKRT
jgi:two-component system, NarL family, response regulator LiaR